MSGADRLLDRIEEGVVEHGGDLGGWTRRADESLQLFDGRVTLRAELHEEEQPHDSAVHVHVFATLHEHEDEVLDACLFGIGDDREGALAQAAVVWITCVAGPIKSFLDGKPVCMTCQAGVAGGDASQGYSPGDSSTVIRARRDGRVETEIPLMSIPAYSRARALAVEMSKTMSKEDLQALCLYNAESHAILQAMEAAGEKPDLTQMKMFPCVVPDRGVSHQTMEAAMATLNALVERSRPPQKKPWWRFW
jgi:hypothetical protein